MLKYKEAAMSKEPVKTKFLIYGQDKETTYIHQAYEVKSNEEILKAIVQLWDMINKYDMLPEDKSDLKRLQEKETATQKS